MFRPASSPPAITTLILLTGLAVLTLNMFLPSLPAMAADFGVSYSRMSLAVSGYFAITAILQLIAGPLSDRFGRRPVMLIGIAIFVAASIVCATAQNDSVFLAARVVQCAVVVGSTLSSAIVRDTAGPAETARLLGLIGTTMALAPMVGPLVGGLIEAGMGWRGSFWLYALLGGIALMLVWSDLGETNTRRDRNFADQFRAYPEILQSARFWSNALCMAFSASTFFTFLSGAPLVAARHFELTPAWVGVAMAVTPLGFMAGNVITTRLTRRMALTRIMVLGRTITVIGLGGALMTTFFQPPAALYFGLMVTVGIGNGLSFPPGYAGVMSVRPNLAGSAAGLAGALMVGMGAVVTALAARGLTPENAFFTLPLMMLGVACAALAAALFARREERARDARPLETGA